MDAQQRDPLAAALFPEDGPPGAGDDPEVARARADVALLRERLGVLAAALTAEPSPAEPVRPEPAEVVPAGPAPAEAVPAGPVPTGPGRESAAARPRRRGRAAAWALAACVALGALGTGGAWLAARPGTTDGGLLDSGAETKRTPGGIVACATDVAEGTVVRAEPLAEDEVRVVLRVERRYGPRGAGAGELVFRGWAAEPSSYYRPGTRMLVVVSRFPDEGVLTFRQDMEPPGEPGEDVGPARDELEYGRKWVAKALAEPGDGECPGRG
ncbi:hypothetical protein SNE510_03330 [Streptomyces sp. NE5-10]|uniref:hypothetical protein n=1 Tax=Streptomyces sp. NE5-10 TaxID=2759674 RepID=UPI001908AF98|nr:hypothetical protein [Streptomyces sp. NE5-10]GHJ90814.1 hypothetical protein SNE510_03330 [Streptomyces sp. NE5-10]